MPSASPWPLEIRLINQGHALRVTFEDGSAFDLDAEYLRVTSPSAEVQGHSAQGRRLVSGKRNVRILEVIATGNYAVRLVFDDGHQTGIYSWTYLHELGVGHRDKWEAYAAELATAGMTRDPK
jgi:DUF971 family protein